MIYKLKSFSCKTFVVFFYLWSGGGPNWCKEYDLWCHEQEAEWTTVGSKLKKSSADVVRSPPPPRKSVFIRLNYLKNYEANYLGQAATPKSASLVLPLPKSFAQRLTLEPPYILDFKKPCVLR
jgi:hypothetical protein